MMQVWYVWFVVWYVCAIMGVGYSFGNEWHADIAYSIILQYSTVMGRQGGKRKVSESEEEQVEDVLAWGNKKENYYQDSQNEYSQLSQEEQQAKKIYENQLQELADDHFYQLPDDHNLQQQDEDDEEQQTSTHLSHAYLTKEIQNATRLGMRIGSERDSKIKALLQSYLQAYLMALIALRDLKIPYVEYHPILNHIMQLKNDIAKLRNLLETSTRQDQHEEQQHFDDEEQGDEGEGEEDGEEDGEEGEEEDGVEEGLRLYEETRARQEGVKKARKEEKKLERQKGRKPMFAKVKENEGRLANEKILKNKGLIKKRKKIDRNGRVKLRRKFDKATSKRRAYGHVIRENPGREYEGERNIKYGRIASTKLK